MKNEASNYLKYAIGETLLVVIGILIALWINNWNDTRRTNNLVNNNLERIEKEILGNQKQIKRVFEYHKKIKDTINKIEIPNDLEQVENKFGFWRGHQIFRLQDAAFQTSIQSGISQNIDIDLLEKLNVLYTNQTFYNDLSKTVTEGIYRIDFESPKGLRKMKNIISMTMVDVYFLESELLERFEDCLNTLEVLKSD